MYVSGDLSPVSSQGSKIQKILSFTQLILKHKGLFLLKTKNVSPLVQNRQILCLTIALYSSYFSGNSFFQLEQNFSSKNFKQCQYGLNQNMICVRCLNFNYPNSINVQMSILILKGNYTSLISRITLCIYVALILYS